MAPAGVHRGAWCLRLMQTLWALMVWMALLSFASANASPDASPIAPEEAAWARRVDDLVTRAAEAATAGRPGVRIDVQTGRLDPRLKLAPCPQVDLYLPPGQKPWGLMRVGLRCTSGPTRWNVFMPVTVRVLAPAVQARQPLPAGTLLGAEHLQIAEVDWAAADSPAFARAEPLLGRTLIQGLAAGATLREADLKRRQWFAIGDVIRVTAVGPGFQVSAEGVALTPGIEGQSARVRTESGRTLTGIATAERRLEVQL